MDISKALEFVRANHRAVLITRHADGRIQSSPVTVGVDADDHVVISSRETAVKTRNVRHNPEVVLTVMTDAFYGQWLQIEGTADVVSLPEAMEPLVDYYRRISGEHPDWDDYRAAMERDRRVIMRVTVTRAGPDFHG
ncbi:PPOX class F420-dependent oxidoreductase [Herbidospora daliensis]|uniref:PPOX class F420-dependent oxidoreductase n=1 Tax=Herbidospora daliensis TaxID=295585 RepID=UPI0007863BB3|nr:PPOX class F420-dependent oxidoreductase [Herbidospora daliensis]